MGDSSSSSWEKSRNHANMVELTGKVMVVSIILLIFIVIFLFCLHLYFKWFFHQREISAATTMRRRRRRRRLDFSAGHHEIVVVMPTSHSHIGLEPSILKSIPVVSFTHDDFKDGLECAVCLCEVCEGEKARILSKCSHGFHVECIDMWFQSHATCPLCRSPVSDEKPLDSKSDGQDYSSDVGPNLPTNVLFWGDETQVNSLGPCMEDDHAASPATEPSTLATTSASGRSNGVVVIDIVGESTNS